MAQTRAVLYPLVSRNPDRSLEDFNKWYDTVHAPARARCPGINSVCRYEAIDGQEPGWLTIYELEDLSALQTPEYQQARINDGNDESTMFLTLDRRVYKLVSDRKRDDYDAYARTGKPRELAHIAFQPGPNMKIQELHDWYSQEHVDLLAAAPGWLRSTTWELFDSRDPRKDPLSADSPQGTRKGVAEFLAYHEYENVEAGFESKEGKAATSTAWRADLMSRVDQSLTERRRFKVRKQF
jgi:hypothetical protein